MSTEKINATAQTWLTSKEAKAALKVSSCDLMHLREAGRVRFQKKGNAFLYAKADIQRTKRRRPVE